MSREYEQYRKTKIATGQLFQDFVVDCCWNLLGLAVVQYTSKLYQQQVGESKIGLEIKNDERFQLTGNLYIELSEKARPRPGSYAQSGINRADNTWLYAIGDYDTIFIFPKNLLLMLRSTGRYREVENNTQTSIGMLLPVDDGEKYAAQILRPNAAEKLGKAVKDLHRLGRELHEAAKKPNGGQMDLFDWRNNGGVHNG